MRQPHRALRLIPILLAGAALAACDQRATDTLASASTARGEGGVAPLLSAGAEAIPGKYVVVMQDGLPGAASAVAREVVQTHGGRVNHTYSAALNGFAANLSPAAVEALRRNPQVKYVAEDAMAYPDQTVQPGATWGLDRVDQRDLPLSTTYSYNATGSGIRVYVIDTGIRTSHVEFGARASVGTDLVGDGQNGQDCNGHGTHVAGTIAGTVYGVAKDAQVISVRVFGCSGGAPFSTIIAAVDWVTVNAVKPAVTNMSLGGGVYEPMNTAVANSIASGVVYAVAAGNESIDACNRSPASTPTAITVGSTASNDTRSYFSNWGTCVDLFAPGSDITSAWWNADNAINTISGTSMATPHTAGVAALYLQANPTATPAAVATALLSTGTPGRIADVGTGSPNLLLHSLLSATAPTPVIGLNPGTLNFTFVRAVGGSAAAQPDEAEAARLAFAASGEGTGKTAPADFGAGHQATANSLVLSGRVLLSNLGTAPLNWGAASNRQWLTADPVEGTLNPTFSTAMTATVNAAGLAAGPHSGVVAVSDGSATANLNVTVNITDAQVLQVGVPRTDLSGAYSSQRYFVVQVPVGATSLTIGTTGGSGDVDMYVRYREVPTFSAYDCRPFMGGNVETCHATNPPPGTYYVMLYGWSGYSGVTLSATTGGPPAAPQGLTSRPATTRSIQLAWADSSVNEAGFEVARRTETAPGAWGPWTVVGTPAANVTSFADSALTAGTGYRYRVRSCNQAGCSAWVVDAALRIPTAPPAAPFNPRAAATSATSATVTWSDGSSDEASFVLARALRNADGSWGAFANIRTTNPNVTSYPNTGLQQGRQYRYQVRACNVAGCSPWAGSDILQMPTAPAAPTSITGTVLSVSSIRVNWADASTNETSFVIDRAPVSAGGVVGAFVNVATAAANQVQFTNNGLAVGSYRFRVRACNVAGCSAPLSTGNVVILPIPAAPAGLTGGAGSPTSAMLAWTDGAGETSYQVYRTLRNLDFTWPPYALVATLPVNSAFFNDPGLLSGRTYRYQVRACNASGCSSFSTSPVITLP
jgi:subtilisin family serine protease